MIKRVKRYLPETHPHLLEEWDYEKNKIAPESITYGVNIKVWWVCKVCVHNWEASIINRAKNKKPRGCPVCSVEKRIKSSISSRITRNGGLDKTHPFLTAEWDYDRNINLSPSSITFGSTKKVYWKCSTAECGYVWKASINNRTKTKKPTGCPACSGSVVTEKNNLCAMFPEIAEEWDFKKNAITPQEVLPGANKKVWWLCKKKNVGIVGYLFYLTGRLMVKAVRHVSILWLPKIIILLPGILS